MRLQGYPCKLSYMGDRIVRFGFITEFIGKVNDEHDIEWEMTFEIYQIADDLITSNTLPVLSTIDSRAQDILGRLNSGANALANVLAILGQPDLARALRNDMQTIVNPAIGAINAMGQAASIFQAAGSIPNMSGTQFQGFTNNVATGALNALGAASAARGIPINTGSTAAVLGGLAGILSRRQSVRAASITTGRVASDLSLMQKDAPLLYSQQQQMHIVGQQDSLRSISQQYYGNSNRWQDIARSNSVVDPQQLATGMRLIIPT
jgi:nucleoid-associated protein YgaU